MAGPTATRSFNAQYNSQSRGTIIGSSRRSGKDNSFEEEHKRKLQNDWRKNVIKDVKQFQKQQKAKLLRQSQVLEDINE